MIHMPHRSVTRFFVPMIDVLLLLFCIFLLMPIADEKDLENAREETAAISDDREGMAIELERSTKELERFKENLPKLNEIGQLQDEIERLKKALRISPQQKYDFQIIDIDGKTGDISWYDPNLPAGKTKVPITSEEDARKLIERRQKEAGENRQVYFHFLLPGRGADSPTLDDVLRYKKWFTGTETSLK